jgi:hypothetical protein
MPTRSKAKSSVAQKERSNPLPSQLVNLSTIAGLLGKKQGMKEK